tara:strand:+ start:22062 stop:22535 length:474 start_codon:yes stop_codon:yes gene_type:complete
MQNDKKHTDKELIRKMRIYCSLQERSQMDLEIILSKYKIDKNHIKNIIDQLILEKHLNEERFSKSFSRGKLIIKKWGKNKIRYELRKKKISEKDIQKAIENIDNTEYNKILSKLYESKKEKTKEKNILIKKKKIVNYLVQKGFENDLIWELINNDKY